MFCCFHALQDGSTELGVSSKDLYPVHHLDDKEFFPGDFVVPADRSAHSALGTYGVVQRVDAQARTALVQWFQPGTTKPDTLQVEEVSVYDLKDHPDFKFRPGSIVVRVADSGDSEGWSCFVILSRFSSQRTKSKASGRFFWRG